MDAVVFFNFLAGHSTFTGTEFRPNRTIKKINIISDTFASEPHTIHSKVYPYNILKM